MGKGTMVYYVNQFLLFEVLFSQISDGVGSIVSSLQALREREKRPMNKSSYRSHCFIKKYYTCRLSVH